VAKRGREAALKRARENARREKQEAKRERRLNTPDSDAPAVDQDALMEEYAQLSARFEANELTPTEFATERDRIFEELGIES
jgi:hypothetical protein